MIIINDQHIDFSDTTVYWVVTTDGGFINTDRRELQDLQRQNLVLSYQESDYGNILESQLQDAKYKAYYENL
jgi:hypothetical protein